MGPTPSSFLWNIRINENRKPIIKRNCYILVYSIVIQKRILKPYNNGSFFNKANKCCTIAHIFLKYFTSCWDFDTRQIFLVLTPTNKCSTSSSTCILNSSTSSSPITISKSHYASTSLPSAHVPGTPQGSTKWSPQSPPVMDQFKSHRHIWTDTSKDYSKRVFKPNTTPPAHPPPNCFGGYILHLNDNQKNGQGNISSSYNHVKRVTPLMTDPF